MLNVRFDNTREEGKGQYFVEITKNRDLSITDCDRLGYWCDKPHLVHIALSLLKNFNTFDLFYELLSEDKQTNRKG